MSDAAPRITRLAPSPTGALHLGNARTFLINWLLARQNGWRILLRIEDLDGPRIKKGADQQAIEDLKWLGLDWDEGPIYQTDRLERYDGALNQLFEQGDAYHCTCTRRDVESALSAPHAEDGSAIYPGTCRNRYGSLLEIIASQPQSISYRFKHIPGVVVRFVDQIKGPQQFDVSKQIGDFVIGAWRDREEGMPSYQLAVVVDDADMGVTDVVRADDLLDSAARQMLLYEHLKLGPPPTYWHLPLVTGPDGRRLAKRHGDTRLASYRDAGVPASRVLQLLAKWCDISPINEPKCAADLLPNFRIEHVLREPIIFTDADHRGLITP